MQADRYKAYGQWSFSWALVLAILLIPSLLLTIFSQIELQALKAKNIVVPVFFIHFLLSALVSTALVTFFVALIINGLVNLWRMLATEAAEENVSRSNEYKQVEF